MAEQQNVAAKDRRVRTGYRPLIAVLSVCAADFGAEKTTRGVVAISSGCGRVMKNWLPMMNYFDLVVLFFDSTGAWWEYGIRKVWWCCWAVNAFLGDAAVVRVNWRVGDSPMDAVTLGAEISTKALRAVSKTTSQNRQTLRFVFDDLVKMDKNKTCRSLRPRRSIKMLIDKVALFNKSRVLYKMAEHSRAGEAHALASDIDLMVTRLSEAAQKRTSSMLRMNLSLHVYYMQMRGLCMCG